MEHFNISVHFSSAHSDYDTAWKYVTKKNENIAQSKNHPDLWNSVGPRNMKAHKAKAQIKISKQQREEASMEVISTSPMQSPCEVAEDLNVGKRDGKGEGESKRCKRLKLFDFRCFSNRKSKGRRI